jgi:snRNA-activating protein complex subunit 3
MEYESPDTKPNFEFEDFAADAMECDVVPELDAECRPDTLTCEGEPNSVEKLLNDIPPDIELATVQSQKQELERRRTNPMYRDKAILRMKYRTRDAPWRHEAVTCCPTSGIKASYPDILLSVQIYRPYTKRKTLTLDLEFNVLGQQSLVELRDRIVCVSDYLAVGDFSDNPDQPCDILTKDLFKSGFFYIEGVFYNDMRDPSCQDYSRNIIEWSKEPSRGVGPFHSQSMESTRFIDLTARLGQPYLYVHQGDCEHIVIFTDLRMLHPEDCCFLEQYPLMVYKSRERKLKCRVCQLYLAKWVTSGSTLAPEDPCFFCDTCFRALHYDNSGKKLVAGMKAYHYPDIRPLKK